MNDSLARGVKRVIAEECIYHITIEVPFLSEK